MRALVIGPLMLAALFLGWLAVHQLWRRAFNLDPETDVLANRCDCASCGRACQRRGKETKDGHYPSIPKE
jgi:hypothetical protein